MQCEHLHVLCLPVSKYILQLGKRMEYSFKCTMKERVNKAQVRVISVEQSVTVGRKRATGRKPKNQKRSKKCTDQLVKTFSPGS